MPESLTKAQRSRTMAAVRGHGNQSTELFLLRFFRRRNIIGWRRNQPVFGKPDFVFPKLRLAVFVDGCFWHGCPRHCTMPVNNAAFWKRKLEGNKRRDRLVNRELRRRGWRVLRIWEHDLTGKADRCMGKLRRALGHSAQGGRDAVSQGTG